MLRSSRLRPSASRALRATFALALLISAAACGDSTSPSFETRVARARWEREGPASYSYTLERGCFCLDEVVRPVVIEVRSGVVASRTYAATGQAVDPRWAAFFPTIDGLFTEIEDAAKRGERVDAAFDRQYGYPRGVSIDADRRAVDGGLSLTVSDFHPL